MAVKDDNSKKNSRGRRILVRTAITGALVGLPLAAITGTASAATTHGYSAPRTVNTWQNTPTQQSDWTYHYDHDADKGSNWFHGQFPTFQGALPAPTVVYVPQVVPAPVNVAPNFLSMFGTGSG